MKNLIFLSLTFLLYISVSCQEKNISLPEKEEDREHLSDKDNLDIVIVHDDAVNSALSYYGTCPESPDGKYLAYVTYSDESGPKASNRLFTHIRYVAFDYDFTGIPLKVDASFYTGTNLPENTLQNNSKTWVVDECEDWIRYDLGMQTEIRKMTVNFGGSGRNYFCDISVATQIDGDYQYIMTIENNGVYGKNIDYKFPKPVKARFVKISVYGWGEPHGGIWICKRDLSNHRLLGACVPDTHNGANLVWATNSKIAYFRSFANQEIIVRDVESGEIVSSGNWGDLSQNAYNGKVVFAINSKNVSSYQDRKGLRMEQGIYELDTNTGEIKMLHSKRSLHTELSSRCGIELAENYKIAHLQISPKGDKIAFRFDAGDKQCMGIVTASGIIYTFPKAEKPLHFLWYDNDHIMGVATNLTDGLPNNREFRLYTVSGEYVETLCGPLTHGASSPNRMYYAGEQCDYRKVPIPFVLYERGSNNPLKELWNHSYFDIVWTYQNHVNPSFSNDGKRIYFNYASQINGALYSRVAYMDISSLIKDN